MSGCQITLQLIRKLVFLLLLSVSVRVMAAGDDCKTVYVTDDTNISTHIKTQEQTVAPLLEATDTAYAHQGSLCLNLINKTASTKNISIYLENPRVRHVELINVTGSTHTLMGVSGMEYPLKIWEKLGAEIIFDLNIPANSSQTFNLNIGSIFAYNSRLLIQDSGRIFNIVTLQQSVTGVLVGFILSLVLYSLLIGLATKEKTYLFLFGSTSMVTLLQLNDMGMLHLLWPDALYWNNISSGVFAIISTICGIGLARNYLATKDSTPRADLWLRILFWYTLVVALPTPFLQNDPIFFAVYALPTVVITLPSLIIISAIKIRQGYAPAKFYLIALLAPVVAGVIIFLMYAGVLPSSQITRALPLVGTAAQLLLFGYAIGRKIEWITQQRNQSINTVLQAKAESEAKKNFLTHVSHELRTPLAGIIGLSEIARKNPAYKENQQLVEGIHDSAELLLSSINMLLDHARVDSGKWKTHNTVFNVRLLVEDIVQSHTKSLGKKDISLNYQIENNTPLLIEGEQNITQKILDCVLEYSINNMSQGHILLKVEPEQHKGLYAIRFDVIDTGDGIAEEHKPEIFEIFELPDHSTTRAQRGMGISLSLGKKLCRLLGGDMDFESNPLHGTAFWCHIPCRPLTNTDHPLIANTAPPAAAETTRQTTINGSILVAEDDETLQLVVASQLEKLEKTFRIYPNGKPLVEDYIKNHDNIAAILLDWNMPICNASAATLLIRDHEKKMQLPPIPIVIMTAHDRASTNELDLPPSIHVLHKPVTINDLSQILTTLQKQ
jgi:signal transduction histidine kinase/CheY-like chemotaxis protein